MALTVISHGETVVVERPVAGFGGQAELPARELSTEVRS
jgi:hypothetical protein